MATVKILIVEDEWVISEDMATKLSNSGYEIIGCAATCQEAIALAKSDLPDIVFLDIKLSGKVDGIETAKRLKEIGDPLIIFLSNLHDENTLKRARELHPANYLLKPFDERQLHISIQQAIHNLGHSEKLINPAERDLTALHKDNLFIRDKNGGHKKYHISDILFIEAERAYSSIHIKNGEKILQSSSMNKQWDKIKHPDLIQVHRSYVVNVNNIEEIKGNVLKIGNHEIVMSETYKRELFQLINFVK